MSIHRERALFFLLVLLLGPEPEEMECKLPNSGALGFKKTGQAFMAFLGFLVAYYASLVEFAQSL